MTGWTRWKDSPLLADRAAPLDELPDAEKRTSSMEFDVSINEDIVILIPVYNDWTALDELLIRLDEALAAEGLEAGVLVVDDGSTQGRAGRADAAPFRALRHIDVLPLKRNLGHQRAMAVSLAFVEEMGRCGTVVLMDGDGEDDPRDVPRLLARCRADDGTRIVFARRSRRSEAWPFPLFYALYRLAYRTLTSQEVHFGNFSVVPRARLSSLVVVSDLWNHYVGAVLRSRQPYCSIETRRGKRLHGKSSMNFVGLVMHGLSAISVYSDVVGIRLLILAALVMAASVLGIVGTVAIRLLTDWAIPGWATYSTGILAILFFQALLFTLILCLVILGSRNAASFIPRRDYKFFIDKLRPL
jgi:glycosyltransferase involved in cell wall biosynthesis